VCSGSEAAAGAAATWGVWNIQSVRQNVKHAHTSAGAQARNENTAQ
jgi:hypothetical protein